MSCPTSCLTDIQTAYLFTCLCHLLITLAKSGPGVDPGFLERGIICINVCVCVGGGGSLCWFYLILSSPEPKAHGWANSIPVTPSSVRRPSVCPSVRQHFQTSSPLKPLGKLNSNFIWRLLRTRERKFVQMVLVTWPRWPPRPYMVKTL